MKKSFTLLSKIQFFDGYPGLKILRYAPNT
jgi:hypothetical protein